MPKRKTRNLKIGVIVDQLLPAGVQKMAIEEVRNLARLGHQAKLLILMRKGFSDRYKYLIKDLPSEFLSDRYPKPLRVSFKFPIFSFLSTLHLLSPLLAPRYIKPGEFDIIVSHGTTTSLTTRAIFKKRKIPYLAVIHDPMAYILKSVYSQTALRFLFPILLPLASFFEKTFVKDALSNIIISNLHYKFLERNYQIKPNILYLGVETITQLPKKCGDSILSFGRWEKEKKPHFLLEIIKKIPDAKLIIAGIWTNKGDYNDFLEEIKKSGLQKRVTIISRYSQKQLAELCAKSRLWVLPHLEAFSLSALEAAAHGLPIILLKKSGVAELFEDGKHGFFPEKLDLSSYIKYIKILLKNPNLAQRMGHTAYQLVKSKYTWRNHTTHLLEIIEKKFKPSDRGKIIVLETGHAVGVVTAGGDILMAQMARHLSKSYKMSLVIPEIAMGHWEKSGIAFEKHILKRNIFDGRNQPIPIFLTYMLRIWQSFWTIQKISDAKILYSSTNVLPDIFPAFLEKIKRPKLCWIARVHHLIPPPHKRPGRLLVNIVSYLMQMVVFWAIKAKADVIIALNRQLANELTKKSVKREKLEVLGAGIDLEQIMNYKPKKVRAFDGVFLGRLHPTKGIFDLVSIWKVVNQKISNAKLAVIGDGPKEIKEKVKEQIDEKGLKKNVFLMGFLPKSKVHDIMKNSKVFLFTDHEAGWGIAVAEAMACNLPVVGYNIGVLGTVYKGGFKKVPLGDYQNFSQEIINLLENDDLRQELAQKAQQEASKLDWTITSKKFIQILNKIVRDEKNH